jgi:hypothetical protein
MFNNLGTALEQLDNLDDARVAYESGGTLGSKEAASSRKRLEGVDSIAIAVVEPASAVHAETPKIREYELVNESDVEEDSASPASSNDEDDAADAETQPGDNATL